MKKKAFGIVFACFGGFNIITRKFWNPFIRWANLALAWYCFFAYQSSWSFACVVT